MPRSQKNDNFIDKTFTIVADILLRTMPTSSREKEAFAYYRDGMSAQAEGEYAEALQNYYEAMRLEVDPYDRSYILYNIGLIHTSNGEHTRALEYYYQALERNPALPQALNNIAVICHYRGEQAIEQGDPEQAEALFDQAAEYWKQALSLAPTNYMEAQNWLVVTGRTNPGENISSGSLRVRANNFSEGGSRGFKLDGIKTDAFQGELDGIKIDAFQGGSADPAPVDDAAPVAEKTVHYSPPLGQPNPENPLVFLNVKLGRSGAGKELGRIVIELKKDVVPRTTENFLQLCQKPSGEGFRDSRFHRVIPNFMCQGGDFTNDDGTGGRSIYGESFADEDFSLKHAGPGVLSMANAGPDTNGSQFFLCVAQTPWLDGKHVVFGQVVEGYDVVKAVEAIGSQSGETSEDVMIADCGVVPAKVAARANHTTPRQAPVRAASAAPVWARSSLGGAAVRTASDIALRGRTGSVGGARGRAPVKNAARFVPTAINAVRNSPRMACPKIGGAKLQARTFAFAH